jgi:aminoglycoside 3-N-acetyltransferase
MNEREVVAELAEAWCAAGVDKGDLLLLHSSASRTLRKIARLGVKPDSKLIVESFLTALGPDGTLLLPLFNFDFAKGEPFDMRTSPSQMGALTEAGRAWPGAVRTGHPIYSFAALGKRAAEFRPVRNFSGYGDDSPFGMLHRADGKIAVLDLPDNGSMTFYHYVEESCSASYRYHKQFTGPYTDEDGVTTQEAFGLFVRDLERGVLTRVDPMGELLWQTGAYGGDRPGIGSGLRTIKARELFERVADVIQAGRAEGLLYEINSVEV